jgi:hypothetical protein
MTTKAAALAIRKGEQKGAIAEKKAAHERVFDLLFFYIHCCALSIKKVVALLAPLAEFNQPPLNANPSHKPEPVRLAFIYMSG